MNALLFNGCLALGWLLITAGICLYDIRLGLAVSGAVLLFLVLFVARLAGVFVPEKNPGGDD